MKSSRCSCLHPILVVYLRASTPTLLQRITCRGRAFERNIEPEYLEHLGALYESWLEDFADLSGAHHPHR